MIRWLIELLRSIFKWRSSAPVPEKTADEPVSGEPKWMKLARQELGVREIAGNSGANPLAERKTDTKEAVSWREIGNNAFLVLESKRPAPFLAREVPILNERVVLSSKSFAKIVPESLGWAQDWNEYLVRRTLLLVA